MRFWKFEILEKWHGTWNQRGQKKMVIFLSHGLLFGTPRPNFSRNMAPYFWKPWMSPYVAAGAFFFQKNGTKIFWSHGPFFWTHGPIFHDILKTKKMRNVRTINLAVVSRRDLCYVSENEGFCFGQNIWISRRRRRLRRRRRRTNPQIPT